MGDAEEVIAIEEHWADAIARGDRAWLEQHTADDFAFITPDGVLLDRETYLERSAIGNEDVLSRVNKAEQAHVVGDVAILVGRVDVRMRQPDGEERRLGFRYSSVYVRNRGVWQGLTAQLTPEARASTTSPT